MKKRVLSVLLLIVILVGAAACTNPSGQNEKTDPPTTSATQPVGTEEGGTAEETLPIKDFRNREFVILTNNRSDDYKSREFACEVTNGNTLNDAVFARNCEIENMYHVILVPLNKTGEADAVKVSVDTDERAYDMALLKLEDAGSLGLGGYLADFNQMPNLKLDGEWWDTNAVKNLSIAGKLFMTIGDMNICDKDMTWCLFFSKKLVTDNRLPDLFQLVREKKWTFEKFRELCANISHDANGDGVQDGSDVWGHVTVFARSTIAYMFSMDTYFVTKDTDDLPVIRIDEKFTTAFEKIVDFFSKDKVCMDVQGVDRGEFANQWKKCEDMFMNDQVLFYAEAMQNAERFRNSVNDFGILPLPSEQEGEYGRHFVWKESYCTTVPYDIMADDERYDDNALLIEAIQRVSSEEVLPAYYDIALKSKFARDVESSLMIDIIFNNRYYDIATYYSWGNLSGTVQSLGKAMSKSYTSTLKMVLPLAERDINNTITALEELDK